MSNITIDTSKAAQLITSKAFSSNDSNTSSEFEEVKEYVLEFINNYPSVSFEYDGNTYITGKEDDYSSFTGKMAEFLATSKVEDSRTVTLN